MPATNIKPYKKETFCLLQIINHSANMCMAFYFPAFRACIKELGSEEQVLERKPVGPGVAREFGRSTQWIECIEGLLEVVLTKQVLAPEIDLPVAILRCDGGSDGRERPACHVDAGA